MTIHSNVMDDGEYLIIVPETRKITVPANQTVIGVVGDRHSEQLTFQCPKTIDGHDIAGCSQHYISWENARGEVGHSDITDITTDDDYVYLKWTVDKELTQNAGRVSFAVFFVDITAGGAVQYQWSTVPCTEFSVLETVPSKDSTANYGCQFIIDPNSRKIMHQSASTLTLTQYDHNSTRFTFQIPKKLNGFDISECNRAEIHFVNISADGMNKSEDVYTADDLDTNGEMVTFSWLVARTATMYDGALSFMVRLAHLTSGLIDYSWNTAKYERITIGTGLNNDAAALNNYKHALTQWETSAVEAMIEKLSVFADIRMVTKEELSTIQRQDGIIYVLKDDTTLEDIEAALEEIPAMATGAVDVLEQKLINGTVTVSTAKSVIGQATLGQLVVTKGTSSLAKGYLEADGIYLVILVLDNIDASYSGVIYYNGNLNAEKWGIGNKWIDYYPDQKKIYIYNQCDDGSSTPIPYDGLLYFYKIGEI